MKKISICLFLVLSFVACDKKNPPEKQTPKPPEIENNKTPTGTLSLTGRIETAYYSGTLATTFTVELMSDKAENNFAHMESQIFVTENGNNFGFDHLHEGSYVLIVSKKGYKTVKKNLEIRKDGTNLSQSIIMEFDENAGFTEKLQVLGDDGQDISEIEFPRNTTSISFYLFNGTGTAQQWNISALPDEGYIGKSFIVNGEIVHLYSPYIKEIKPASSGNLNPNEIVLIEVVIDPLLYTIKAHSSCKLSINYNQLTILLSY